MVFASLFGGNGIFGRGGAGMSRVGWGEMWREVVFQDSWPSSGCFVPFWL